jgi:hypothetical protein
MVAGQAMGQGGRREHETMSTRRGVAAFLTSLAVVTALALVTAGPAGAYDFPSTNDANRAANLPHVDLVSTGPGTVTLEFINTRRVSEFFEYRIDGQTVGTTPHPVVDGDVIHPGVCVDGRTPPPGGCASGSLVQTFEADATVEVRLALGAERDWDFDWTSFAVGPKLACGTPGTNRFSVGDASIVEGDSGKPRQLRVPVTISNPTNSTIRVDYVVEGGTATNPDDFTAKVGQVRTLTFKPSGAGIMPTTKYVTVKVNPDIAVEGDEDLTVTLSNPTGGYTIGRDVGTGTILDDDDTSGQSVAVSSVSACEGDTSAKGNKLGYQLSLRNPAATDLSVTVAVAGGTATGGVDYKAMPKPKTVKIKTGQVQKTVNVTTFADLAAEPDEDVVATITAAPVPTLAGAASADAVLLDDDSGGSLPI